jgi:hypothetical protein
VSGSYDIVPAEGALEHDRDKKLDVTVTLPAPIDLVQGFDGEETHRIMTVCLDGVFAPPARYLPDGETVEANPFTYLASFTLPMGSPVTLSGGELKHITPPGENDGDEAPRETDEDPDDDMNAAFYKESEAEGALSVKFPATSGSRRVFIFPASVAAIKESVEAGTPLQFGFRRVVLPGQAEDHNAKKYAAWVNVSLDDLVNIPGRDFAGGAIPLGAYDGDEFDDTNHDAPPAKPPAKGAKAPSQLAEEPEDADPENCYVAAKTYARISLTLDSAIVPRPPTPPKPTLRPSDIIPRRSKFTKHNAGTASENFQREVADVIGSLAVDYSDLADSDKEGRLKRL